MTEVDDKNNKKTRWNKVNEAVKTFLLEREYSTLG
jgi:hypothetical protein